MFIIVINHMVPRYWINLKKKGNTVMYNYIEDSLVIKTRAHTLVWMIINRYLITLCQWWNKNTFLYSTNHYDLFALIVSLIYKSNRIINLNKAW